MQTGFVKKKKQHIKYQCETTHLLHLWIQDINTTKENTQQLDGPKTRGRISMSHEAPPVTPICKIHLSKVFFSCRVGKAASQKVKIPKTKIFL